MEEQTYKAVLWDIKEGEEGALPRDFVIRRTLSYGTLGLIVRAIKEDGLNSVREVFLKMKPTAMSAKKYHYLKNYLLA